MRLHVCLTSIVLLLQFGCEPGPVSIPNSTLNSKSKSALNETAKAGVDDTPISAAQLNERTVIGQLGVELGTAVEITAEIISGDSLRLKAHVGQYLLKVTHVNRVALKDPPTLEFQVPGYVDVELASGHFDLFELKHGERAERLDTSQIQDLESDYVGKTVRLGVYECGIFSGFPKNTLPGMTSWAARGYYFRTYLVVVTQR